MMLKGCLQCDPSLLDSLVLGQSLEAQNLGLTLFPLPSKCENYSAKSVLIWDPKSCCFVSNFCL